MRLCLRRHHPRRAGRSPRPAPAPAVAPPIDVSVKGEREEPSTIHIPRSETQFVAGAFGDPFKIVEALPGMAPWLSGLPYYYVRGSPPESVGYFVDGIRIPLLFHVGPGPSTIAPALVDSVDLFPGAYPPSIRAAARRLNATSRGCSLLGRGR
jgi:hypothetical protein